MNATKARRKGLPLLLLGALALALLRGASAQPERPLSRGLPAGALLLLEADDLRGLLTRWKASPLRQAYHKSATGRDLEKSKIYLKLLSRIEQLEEASGASIGLDFLLRSVGQRGAFGVYDIGETAFLLATELPAAELRRGDPLGLRGKLKAREHRGVPYLLQPEEGAGAKRRPPLLVALLGNRLLVGNDQARFQDALVLSARELGLKVTAAPAGRPEPQPAAEDAVHKALEPALAAMGPQSLRIYVAAGALAGNRYFDRYWIFGADSAAGISGAVLGLSVGDVTTETRAYAYEAGQEPRALGAARGVDVAKVAAALPEGAPYAQAAITDAEGAAAVVAELLPLPAEADKEARAALQAALAAAGPTRLLEVVDPQGSGFAARHQGAVALALQKGAQLSAEAWERALLKGLEGALGVGRGGPPVAFVSERGARVLRLPLLGGWALSWERRGDALLLATEPEALTRLSGALALLKDGEPVGRRLELDRAAAYYQGMMKVLTQRDNWSDGSHAAFFSKNVGGLAEVVRPVRRMVSAAYRRQAPRPLVLEEVRYLP